VADDRALAALLDEVVDRYGPAPPQLANLLAAQRLRVAAQRAGVASVARRGSEWRVQLDSTAPAPPELGAIVGRRTDARVTPTGEIRLPAASDDSLDGVRSLLEDLAAARADA
jgi:transcription-repair coupling factor (superfamily II helicase)